MMTHHHSDRGQVAFPFSFAVGLTVLMGAVYTALDDLQPLEPLLSVLAFVPGAVSAVVLAAAGMSRETRRLRFRGLSPTGVGVLGAVTLLLPILGSSTGWAGWTWLPGLVYAPASGIAQELYFRGSLLPALEKVFHGRTTMALQVPAGPFVGFHLRTFRSISELGPAILVAIVLFAGGCGWGWQVQRDRTVLWAMVQHSLFLFLMSVFTWT